MVRYEVFQNIEESPYFIDKYGFRFYFSSKVYLEKFKNRLDNFIEIEKIKLKNRYKYEIFSLNKLVVAFYCKIESRGFRVYLLKDGKEIERLKQLNE